MRRRITGSFALLFLVACASGRSGSPPRDASPPSHGSYDVVLTVENRLDTTAYIYRQVGATSRILVATVPPRHTDRIVLSSEAVGVDPFVALDERGRIMGSERVTPRPNSEVIIRRKHVQREG